MKRRRRLQSQAIGLRHNFHTYKSSKIEPFAQQGRYNLLPAGLVQSCLCQILVYFPGLLFPMLYCLKRWSPNYFVRFASALDLAFVADIQTEQNPKHASASRH